MRLIDADKLVDMLYDNEFASLCPLDEVSGVIDACPTVDAVPLCNARTVYTGMMTPILMGQMTARKANV